jgi:hypothetical protein
MTARVLLTNAPKEDELAKLAGKAGWNTLVNGVPQQAQPSWRKKGVPTSEVRKTATVKRCASVGAQLRQPCSDIAVSGQD